MARRNSYLLAEIERDVLDESKSVAAALRKCLALGGQAKSAELRDWASRELHGYPDEAPLPDYRKIRTPLLIDGFTGGGTFRSRQVSVIDLPEEARGVVGDELPLTFGAGKIEALIRQAEARGGTIDLGPAAAAELALMMTHEIGRYQVERVYWSAGTGVLCGVIDAIRTTLTELVTEIRAGTAGRRTRPRRRKSGRLSSSPCTGRGTGSRSPRQARAAPRPPCPAARSRRNPGSGRGPAWER